MRLQVDQQAVSPLESGQTSCSTVKGGGSPTRARENAALLKRTVAASTLLIM